MPWLDPDPALKPWFCELGALPAAAAIHTSLGCERGFGLVAGMEQTSARLLTSSFSQEELRGAWSAIESIIRRSSRNRRSNRPLTSLLIHRKLDALSGPALDSLTFILATKTDLSSHQVGGISRVVRYFQAEVAEEVAYVHNCGAVVSEKASKAAYSVSSHMLRLALGYVRKARGNGLPLHPVATDKHLLAVAAFQKGEGGNEKAALEVLGLVDARVLENGDFVSSTGLLIGAALCGMVIRTEVSSVVSPGRICCGSCLRVFKCNEVSTCRRCGDHLACNACLAGGEGHAQHARECSRVRAQIRVMAAELVPFVRKSVRRVAMVRLDDLGLIVPMHISSIISPLTPSSLWEALSRCSAVASHDEITIHWRMLVAFLACEDGDEQEASAYEGGNQIYSTLLAAERAIVENERFIGPANKAPLLPSEKRRLREGLKATEERAKDAARAAADAVAMAEANSVLERQSARADATSAVLTSVLAKRGSAASPEVVARVRAQRDALKATERAARRPVKGELRAEIGRTKRCNEDLANARSAAALVLQQHVRAWFRGRKKARRKQRSHAAKCIQRSVRARLLSRVGVSATPSIPTAAPSSTEDDNEDRLLCVCCLERPRVVMFLACAHLCACEECAPLMVACPLCRAEGAKMRVYI